MGEPWSYDGQRVIVSGGGGAGMGAAVVRLVTALGAEVHVVDLKEPEHEVASYQAVNLSDPDATAAAVDRVGGRVDALFNCVGVAGPPFSSDIDTMTINFIGVRHLTELVVERMDRGGAIASIASTAGVGWESKFETFLSLFETATFAEAHAWCDQHPDEIATGYTPSKQAVVGWTHYACNALGARNVRINCTLPGPTETPLFPNFKAKVADGFWDSYPIPLGRFQTPDEQAAPLVFLNSRGASAITGAALIVDGGTVSAAAAGQVTIPTLKRPEPVR